MEPETSPPAAWVLHDRELDDVCRALARLEVPFERCDGRPPERLLHGARLVAATPQRALELDAAACERAGVVRIAVCDRLSRTLSAGLAGAGVDFVLSRPVHPEALRLLLLHVLYAGPEKRRARRVSVGAPIRLRAGWRSRRAVLLELSGTGCRLNVARPPAPGARVTVVLPGALTGSRRLRLRGTAVRRLAAAADDRVETGELAVQLDPVAGADRKRLAAVVRRHARGPAVWTEATPREGEATPDDGPVEEASPRPMGVPPVRRRARERRSDPRRRYDRPVLAHTEARRRVLMGRDLSPGGMRVLRDEALEIGDRLDVVLYGEEGSGPLPIQAEVAREDGAYMLLRFAELEDADRERLERIMATRPVVARDQAGRTSPLVVSEVVATRSRERRAG